MSGNIPLNIPNPDPSALTAIAVKEERSERRLEIAATERLLRTEMAALKELVTALIGENDIRSRMRDDASKLAVEAAFASAAQRFKSIEDRFSDRDAGNRITSDALADKINDAKDRLTKVEAGTQGARDYRGEKRLETGVIIGISGVVVAILAIFASLFLNSRQPVQPVTQMVPQQYVPAPVAPVVVPK